MRFWDSSAVLPLILEEPNRDRLLALQAEDDEMAVWWGTSIECHSALSRRFREGAMPVDELQLARANLRSVLQMAREIAPTEPIRVLANRLVGVYPLRAADGLQLAASLTWAEEAPAGRELVSLDQRLRQVALQEGFTVRP